MTIGDTCPPLILTLKLDSFAFGVLDDLRRRHFPPQRNFLSAHVTLFHKLPGEHERAIRQTLQSLCVDTAVMSVSFPALRFLGKGVAADLDCPELLHLRRQLAVEWNVWLGAQDKQTYRPHVTIQNKVIPEHARRLYDHLRVDWQALAAHGEGLLLWRYLNGPWELAQEFSFRDFVQTDSK